MRLQTGGAYLLPLAKVLVAFAVALGVTMLTMLVVPFEDFGARTPGKVVAVAAFYTTLALVLVWLARDSPRNE